MDDLLQEMSWLKGLARRLIADPDQAEDALQDAYLAALNKPPRSRAAIKNWFKTTLRRKAQDARGPRVLSLGDDQPMPDRKLELRSQRELIDAVLALSPENRDLILRRFWDHQPPRRIAADLGIPVETLRSRLRRALDLLRLELDRSHGDRRSWMLMLPLWAGRPSALDWFGTTAMKGAFLMSLKHTSMAVAVLVLAFGVYLSFDFRREQPPVWTETVEELAEAEVPRPQRATGSEVTTSKKPIEESDPGDSKDVAPSAAPIRIRGLVREIDTERIVPGAAVIARTGIMPSEADPRVVVDDQGRFVLTVPARTELENLRYEVRHADYALRIGGEYLDLQPQEDGSYELTRTLHLRPGCHLSGRVLDARDRSPLADAVILPMDGRIGFFAIGNLRGHARTDSDGAFRTPWRVQTLGCEAVFAVSSRGLGWCRTMIGIGQAELKDLEILVHPGVDLKVRVVDERGRAVEDAQVLALPRFAPITSNPEMQPRSRTPGLEESLRLLFGRKTDEKGEARFQNLPIEKPFNDRQVYGQFVGDRRPYVVQISARGFEFFQSDDVDLADPVARDLEFRLGRSREHRVAGRVRRENGEPMTSAVITCKNDGREFATDDQGCFAFPIHFEPLRLGLDAASPGYSTETLFFHAMPAPYDIEELDIVLKEEVETSGRVVDQDGRPLEALEIHLWEDCVAPRHPQYRSTSTDAEGCFTIPNSTRGPWILRAETGPNAKIRIVSRNELKFSGGDKDVEFCLDVEEVGSVTVDVDLVDCQSGRALLPTEARIHRNESWPRGRSRIPVFPCRGPDLLAQGLSPGPWRLEGKVGTRRFRHDFEIGEGEVSKKVVVRLGAPAIVRGHVDLSGIPEDKRPKQLFLISEPTHEGHAIEADGSLRRRSTRGAFLVREDGAFAFGDVTPGTRFGLRSVTAGVLVFGAIDIPEEGGELRLDLRAELGAELEVSVPDLGDDRLSFAIERSDGHFDDFRSRFSGASRPQSLNVSAGRVRWRARHLRAGGNDADSFCEWFGELELRAGEKRQLRLELPER